MEIVPHFDHMNINVTDVDRSIDFYAKALSLQKLSETKAPDGSFTITYLGYPGEDFRLELTWLKDHPEPYDLHDNEIHLAIRVKGDYEKIREYHRSLGIIGYENKQMGIYFIVDPDGYWTEILPTK
ncbi:MAG: lactoylglutathione lyase [Bacteroidales bacterium]|nr:lactoylglutathione lyase [Bacteroidales bacterium]